MAQELTLIEIQNNIDLRRIVGRYVNLVSRGDALVGLCPFHRADSMTFSVDTSLRICSCSECGRGWSAVDFLMSVENLTYDEALARLAADDGIEIAASVKPDPETTLRSAMFHANEFAADYFHRTLLDTPAGQTVGLAYFRERGINDDMISRFALGYSLEDRTAFASAATAAGIGRDAMLRTGLVVESERGELYDRYRGRVVYPVFTVSGRPVAFGARTLRTDKDVAKYVNSPESEIYSKSNELYGLYQAREAIVREDRCILVEGYMDVISMHQAGICNVVASSGTSLTEGQVAMIRRFTNRITVIYDADAAGVKASVRSIDMLLSADFDMDVVSLPEGEDPDSFARSHSREEIETYLRDNAIDFVRFKLRLAADRISRDPIERSRVISDIVNSISLIPDKRSIRRCVAETSQLVRMSEKTIQEQVSRRVTERRMRRAQAQPSQGDSMPDFDSDYADTMAGGVDSRHAATLRPFEREVLGYLLRNAMLYFCDQYDNQGNVTGRLDVARYIETELLFDDIAFVNTDFARLYNKAIEICHATDDSDRPDSDFEVYRRMADAARARIMEEGMARLRELATDLQSIQAEEQTLNERADQSWQECFDNCVANHVALILMADPDQSIRSLTTELVRPHERLSRIHSRGSSGIASERTRLLELIPRALFSLKYAIVQCRITDLRKIIAQASAAGDIDRVLILMQERKSLDNLKSQLAPYIGDVVITTRR